MTEREQIARIIEPEFFERGFEALVGAKMAHYQADALAKADLIIALRTPDALSRPDGEVEKAAAFLEEMTQIYRPEPNGKATGNRFQQAAALLRRLQAERDALSLTPGWKLVPVEPTEAMLNCVINSPPADTWADVYRAMLDAAPSVGVG